MNSTLVSFEQSVNEETTSVATQMLVFKVRGLVFIKLNFPYAQYPTHSITADYLFPIAWEVVKDLECADFKVISLTGDKASPNRKFICMHRLGTVQKFGTTYKIRNPTVLKSNTYTQELVNRHGEKEQLTSVPILCQSHFKTRLIMIKVTKSFLNENKCM